MTDIVRRACAFAAVGSLALAAPIAGGAAAVVFLAIAVIAAFVVTDGPVFELFARPGDRKGNTLYGLAGVALAATGLALLAMLPGFGLPLSVFVGTVLLLSYGNVGEQVVRSRTTSEIVATVGFGVVAFLGAVFGMVATARLSGDPARSAGEILFLAAAGALLAALLRSLLLERDDPLVMSSVGILLWFLADLTAPAPMEDVLGALAVTLALGYGSFALGAASIPGMLTGVFLGLLTLVLGGPAWFVVLVTFFGVGALATKYRYDQKVEHGVAQENEGARGSGNVLGNSAVALLALLGYAASPNPVDLPEAIFLYAFVGSLATALSDTLSSEIGGVYDDPRLITTLEVTEPGTDGAVTWQGVVAGTAGAAAVAAIALLLYPAVEVVGAATVVAAGFVGMNADSIIGATLEGDRLGNKSVNFLATLVGAVAAAGFAGLLGL
ncbi:DUF92 domain-containing protein [Halobacteriales archaeon QS_1_68_20]|nr:MAG: DUF92 domain-containing protein [Halobacteriales archaeon QS_1_68_20]